MVNQRQMLLLRPAPHHFNDCSHRGDQIAGCDGEFLFAGLDFGHIKHVVNQSQEMLAAAADRGDVFTLIGVGLLSLRSRRMPG
jgi:hypothetical protein